MEHYMKQAEYVKLVVTTTTLNTKLKLQQEQIMAIAATSQEHITAAEIQLQQIQAVLTNMAETIPTRELANAASIQQRNLLNIERELKSFLKQPVELHTKQILALKEALIKIQEHLPEKTASCEFDLSEVQELMTKSQESLDICERHLQTIMQKYLALQERLNTYLQLSTKLMLEHEIEETTHKASSLTRKLTAISTVLEETPALATKHAKQFTPLRQALATLNAQTRLLSLTATTSAEPAAAEPIAATAAPQSPELSPLSP